ncbi:hypothetical protein [Methylobacterium gnaphalii]|uniref:Uncharacterized protein n=1 Tax=Methylobacterium gnaphalii TaxID=1010610 RepID=A0A512JRX7_9HYPH|nr:hypothetical protein [Methylobacterium gnaphalii]GEP12662.1 hypothetical protein MGN01_45070 [Methylobacterium gnaphalii]GJD71368.1 hypothetical protein MMMDOFMJ_4324 [Methylobacterium gnaphalii]GLS51384.1 hypothetical protein GCM10007885_42410 [Methylobacterium gnaphalii]
MSPTTYSLTSVDTTAAGQAYVSGGLAVEYLEDTAPRNQIGVYDANHTDAETTGGAWRGVRNGRAASPTLAGYDGKHAFTSTTSAKTANSGQPSISAATIA